MQKFKLVWIVLFLLFLSSNVNATYTVIGCVSDDTGWLYTGPAGVNSPRGYGPAYETTPVVTSGQLGTGIYCAPVTLGNCVIRTKSRCTECTGPYDYDSSRKRTDYYYEQAGKLKGYMMCPIDDYIPFLLIAISGVAIYFLRERLIMI